MSAQHLHLGLGASALLKLAVTIVNLICTEISVTAVWLPSSHVLQLALSAILSVTDCVQQILRIAMIEGCPPLSTYRLFTPASWPLCGARSRWARLARRGGRL